MQGLMMDYPLTISMILERARLFPRQQIVTRGLAGTHRYTYSDLYLRVCKLANVLKRLGIEPGERVATLAWNTYAHLEVYLGAPSCGAVLHTLNLRLPPLGVPGDGVRGRKAVDYPGTAGAASRVCS